MCDALRGDAHGAAPRRFYLNRMMLEERFTTDDPIVLASPVAGTGIPLPVLEALNLRLVTEISRSDSGASGLGRSSGGNPSG